MVTAAEISAKIDEAIAANESGDYALALDKLASARMLLVATPNSSHDGSSVQWDRASIDNLIAQVRASQTRKTVASGGIRRTNITYRRTSRE